jgi:hypothetical protein
MRRLKVRRFSQRKCFAVFVFEPPAQNCCCCCRTMMKKNQSIIGIKRDLFGVNVPHSSTTQSPLSALIGSTSPMINLVYTLLLWLYSKQQPRKQLYTVLLQNFSQYGAMILSLDYIFDQEQSCCVCGTFSQILQ